MNVSQIVTDKISLNDKDLNNIPIAISLEQIGSIYKVILTPTNNLEKNMKYTVRLLENAFLINGISEPFTTSFTTSRK